MPTARYVWQVACFTATTVGAEAAMAAQLPMGTSQEHSEQLLQQTAEAGGVELRCASAHRSAGTWLGTLVV